MSRKIPRMKVKFLLDLLSLCNPDAEIRVHAMSAGFDQHILDLYTGNKTNNPTPSRKAKFVDIDVGARDF
jgi:hypothetical protein